MIASHIHDALAQVRRMQELILAKRRFQGYSGPARLIGGVCALAGAAVLASPVVAPTPQAQLAGWAVVCLAALALNYGALIAWFLFNPSARRDTVRLTPAIDAIPALAVGALLSLVLVLREDYELLFGIWMCLYGLAHVGYRQSLPALNYAVGVYYIVCGAYCLLDPRIHLLNPWPMGIVFGIGETAGGIILHRNRQEAGSHVE